MNRFNTLKAALLIASLLALPVAYAATISKVGYRAGKTCISADYKTDKAVCAPLTANAKDVCVQEAKEKERVALADARMGKEIGEAKKDAVADKVDADYKVAIEKCDALAGNAKTGCVAAAKAKFGKN